MYTFSEMLGYITLFSFSFDAFNELLGNAVVNITAGILLTHMFRLVFKRYNWIKLPITSLVIRCTLAIAGLTVITAALNIPMDGEIINTEKVNWIIRDLSYLINLAQPLLIWVLIYVVYSFVSEQQRQVIERMQLESSVKESEAKILRAQMNPHFIFNALNSIRALVSEEPKKAISGVTQLSNILRSSLVADRQTTVTLKEELKTIEDYLALEKVRYEERLQSKIQIEPEAYNFQVPPMMLQTLVENAIKHGVQKANRWGFIEISAKVQTNKLYLKVRNTGTLSSADVMDKSSGFGVENTIKRLKLLFGNDASFNLYQENEHTVCADIEIPKYNTL